MTSLDWQLLATALGSVLFLVALIVSRVRQHPLLALLVTAVGVGIVTGMPLDALVKSITTGAGNTLGAVGLVVALGAMLGRILADSGVTEGIAEGVMRHTSTRSLPWAMMGVAFVIGIPMFFEVGLVVMLPLVFSIARKLEKEGTIKGSAYVYVAVPVIAALAAMHGMVPPHPGPLTAIAQLHGNVGATMIYGIIAAIPAMILAGPVYGAWVTRRLSVQPEQSLIDQFAATDVLASGAPRPGLAISLLTALLPAILMLCHSIAELTFDKGAPILKITGFIGAPIIAMLISVIFASVVLVYFRKGNSEELRKSLSESLKAIASVLLIIAGGGAFQHVLSDAKVGDAIMHMSQFFSFSPLVLGWIIAMLLSVSTGSATIGIVGAAGLLAPLAGAGDVNASLLALSIGCGSLFFNYANHAGFWLVKESFGMTMGEATMTISVIQSIVAVVGLVMVLLMNLLPAIGSV